MVIIILYPASPSRIVVINISIYIYICIYVSLYIYSFDHMSYFQYIIFSSWLIAMYVVIFHDSLREESHHNVDNVS